MRAQALNDQAKNGNQMTYLWRIPDKYPQSLIGVYDKNNIRDRFSFKRGEKITIDSDRPIINFENATLSRLSNFGCLASNVMVPIVNEKICKVLSDFFPDDVQFCDVIVRAKDGDSEEFKLVNVINTVKGIDHDKSTYTLVPGTQQIMGFRALKYQDRCMTEKSQLARDSEYLSHLIVSEKVCDVLSELNLPGLAFYKAEDIAW